MNTPFFSLRGTATLLCLGILLAGCAGSGSAGQTATAQSMVEPGAESSAKPLPSPPASVASLLNAERSFAATARDEGTRKAFLDNLDADAILFRPGPVKARQWMQRWSGSTGLLSWSPVYAEVSANGDLGYTVGPWQYRGTPDSEAPTQTGYYLAVWRRNEMDTWRLFTEIGTVSDAPESVSAEALRWKTASGTGGTLLDSSARQDELDRLLDLDRMLSDSTAARGWDALLPHLAGDVRFAGMDEPLVTGRNAVLRTLKENLAPLAWEPQTGAVAASGDLACTLGRTYPAEYAEGERVLPDGSYVHVWRKAGDGRWIVAAVAQIPFSRH